MPQSFAEQLKSFPLSPNLGASLERAHGFARDQSHRLVTLEHLLLALAEDPEAVIIMQSANVDLARLTTDVSTHLGRLLEDMRTDGDAEPRPDPELLRVLQAAASAALQSRRRQIDGAIVLAAIVGDGKSPAAGMLKALGMTFEEAIRALQRANTKARLKPQTTPAASATAAAPLASPVPTAAPVAAQKPATPAPAQANGAQKPEPVAPVPLFSAQQTAEEILTAARERIRQRAAAAKAERAAQSPPEPEATPEPPAAEPEPVATPEAAANTTTLAGAIEAATATPSPPEAEPEPEPDPPPAAAPAQPAPQPQARSPWTPPAEPQTPPAPRMPPIARRAHGPPLPRPIEANQGPPRPPLPLAGGQRPLAKFPPPPRAPWPDSAEPAQRPRLPLPNGNLGSPQHPTLENYTPGSPWPNAQRSGQTERGPLVENVPRVMRVGVSVPVEVHIARNKIENLIMALNGRGTPGRPDAFVTRAVSVRLRAPQGGFWIEATSPETQWAEGSSSQPDDDHAVWRWTVLPNRRGRSRLLLEVSARTVGQDGVPSESAPPHRVIDIKVKSNKARRLGSLIVWLMVLSIGAALGYFGQDALDTALPSIRHLIGN